MKGWLVVRVFGEANFTRAGESLPLPMTPYGKRHITHNRIRRIFQCISMERNGNPLNSLTHYWVVHKYATLCPIGIHSNWVSHIFEPPNIRLFQWRVFRLNCHSHSNWFTHFSHPILKKSLLPDSKLMRHNLKVAGQQLVRLETLQGLINHVTWVSFIMKQCLWFFH